MLRSHTEAHIHHHALGELARRYGHAVPTWEAADHALLRLSRAALLPYTPIGRAMNAPRFRMRLPEDPFIVRRPREDEKG